MGDQVPHPGKTAGQHLRRNQAHPRHPKAYTQAVDDGWRRGGQQDLGEDVPLGRPQHPGRINQRTIDRLHTMYGAGQDGEQRTDEYDEQHGNLQIIQIIV